MRHTRYGYWLEEAGPVEPTLPLAAGEIHGKVTCKGVRDSGDAVVYVAAITGRTFPAAKEHAKIDQANLVFAPHVLPVLVGTTVDFHNSDAVLHNVFSPDFEKYNLGTWPLGQTKDHTFAKCAKAPCAYVQLCRVHPEMEGYIVVLQNPFYAVSGKDGRYKIDNVPPGAYSVGVWHAKLKSPAKPVTVDGAKPAVVDFVLSK